MLDIETVCETLVKHMYFHSVVWCLELIHYYLLLLGQVLSRANIEEIIKFAHKEELFILADEVRKELIPWSRVLFEKIMVTQLVKKMSHVLWNPKVHYHVDKGPPLVLVLCQMNSVHTLPPSLRLPKIHSNIFHVPNLVSIFSYPGHSKESIQI
jgi:hypothetical protein